MSFLSNIFLLSKYKTEIYFILIIQNINNHPLKLVSSIKINNLLSGINAYQTYKLRKGS